MVTSILAVASLSLLGRLAVASSAMPSISQCLLNTFPERFSLIPVNLYPETEIAGPTSLDAINFITLGIPTSSDYGDVAVESFTLKDSLLYEQSGLPVRFVPEDGYYGNDHGVTETSVLKANECDGDCYGSFCVDTDGYLVSVNPLLTCDGEYESHRVKFYACPNGEQDIFGGGEYKIYSNNAPDQYHCVPIYLGVKGIPADECEEEVCPCEGEECPYPVPYPEPYPVPYPAPLEIEPLEVVYEAPPMVTQIWDGQVQAPPLPVMPVVVTPYVTPYVTPVVTAITPVPMPAPAPAPAPAPEPVPVPAPAPVAPELPLPPLVSEIFDGQLQAPVLTPAMPTLTVSTEAQTPGAMTMSVVNTPESTPTVSTAPSSPPTFQGSAGRVLVGSAAAWIVVAVAMGLAF